MKNEGNSADVGQHECQLAGQKNAMRIDKRAGDNAAAGRSPSHRVREGKESRECRELRVER
jgi:hypothetical protein